MNTVNGYFIIFSRNLADWDGTGSRGVLVRRLLFEALDAYLPIWWLGVVRRDREALADEVRGLFMSDQLRRMTVESVLPFVISPQAKIIIRVLFLRSRQAPSASKNRVAL